MAQRVRFAAAASGAAALAYVLYREIRHLATRPQKLAVLGRVEGRFQAASLDQMVRCDAKRLRRMLRALLLGAAPESISDERLRMAFRYFEQAATAGDAGDEHVAVTAPNGSAREVEDGAQ